MKGGYSNTPPKDGGGEVSKQTQGYNMAGCEDADQNKSMVNAHRKGGYGKGNKYQK